nr:PREDICTED: protein YABBY 2-like isoform X2 [Musa acuminata subsp. malaccensis]
MTSSVTTNLVNVPHDNSFNIVTVRCGLCANILYVNLEALLGKLPLQNLQSHNLGSQHLHMDSGSSSTRTSLSVMSSMDFVQQQMQLIHPSTEKRRAPSAYNRFIKEEIQRLKAKNPNISHKEAFSTAAKNWAHFPEIHFGLSIKGNKQV